MAIDQKGKLTKSHFALEPLFSKINKTLNRSQNEQATLKNQSWSYKSKDAEIKNRSDQPSSFILQAKKELKIAPP